MLRELAKSTLLAVLNVACARTSNFSGISSVTKQQHIHVYPSPGLCQLGRRISGPRNESRSIDPSRSKNLVNWNRLEILCNGNFSCV